MQRTSSPRSASDERHRIDLGYRHAQNFGADPDKLKDYIEAVKHANTDQFEHIKKPNGTVKDHCTFEEAWDFFGERLRGIRVIAIARNPYQTILSRLNHMARFEDYRKSGQAIQASKEQLQEELNLFIKKLNNRSYPKNISHYTPPSHASIPLEVTYLKFEHLQTELNQFLASLNISEDVSYPTSRKVRIFQTRPFSMLLMRINFRSSTITSTTNSKLWLSKTEGSARLTRCGSSSTGMHGHGLFMVYRPAQTRPVALQRLLSSCPSPSCCMIRSAWQL